MNKRGFSVVQVLLLIVLIVAVAGTGWYVWQSKNKTNKTFDTASIGSGNLSKKTPAVTDFESCKNAGNPIQESSPEQCSANGKTYTNESQTPAGQASAEDDTSIRRTILADCTNKGATVGSDLIAKIESNMKDPSLYVKEGNFARISASCDLEGGGFRAFLQKKNDIWTILGAGQMNTISCSVLDGSGIPAKVVATCFDINGNERAIK